MTTDKLIPFLEEKLKKAGLTHEEEMKYHKNFSKYATRHRGGIYEWKGYKSTDTRELFLMGVAGIKGIQFVQS